MHMCWWLFSGGNLEQFNAAGQGKPNPWRTGKQRARTCSHSPRQGPIGAETFSVHIGAYTEHKNRCNCALQPVTRTFTIPTCYYYYRLSNYSKFQRYVSLKNIKMCIKYNVCIRDKKISWRKQGEEESACIYLHPYWMSGLNVCKVKSASLWISWPTRFGMTVTL